MATKLDKAGWRRIGTLIPWLSTCTIALGGWVEGLVLFSGPSDEYAQFRESSGYIQVACTTFAYSAFLATVCGVLRSRSNRILQTLGTVLLVTAAFPLGFGLLLSAFSPCLGPNDACLISWPHHLLSIVAALLGLSTGLAIELRARAGAETR